MGNAFSNFFSKQPMYCASAFLFADRNLLLRNRGERLDMNAAVEASNVNQRTVRIPENYSSL